MKLTHLALDDKMTCTMLKLHYTLYLDTVPFSETTEARALSLQLYVTLEQLVELAKSLLGQCHVIGHVTGSGQGLEVGSRWDLVEDTCQQLMDTLSHQTALYCSKILAVSKPCVYSIPPDTL